MRCKAFRSNPTAPMTRSCLEGSQHATLNPESLCLKPLIPELDNGIGLTCGIELTSGIELNHSIGLTCGIELNYGSELNYGIGLTCGILYQKIIRLKPFWQIILLNEFFSIASKEDAV